MATVDDDTTTTTTTLTPPARLATATTEAIRQYFRNDGSRMTMMAARKFRVSEQAVVEALVGGWPITRLRDGTFRELMNALPNLGPVRVFVRSKAAVMETVGVFGGLSESGPFFNVQTETLDMHILPEEIATIYAVEKTGHDSTHTTHSFQFFDRGGDAAFKVFLWEDFPNVPAARIETFRTLTRHFAAAATPDSTEARPQGFSSPVPTPAAILPQRNEEPESPAEDAEPAPPRLAIPIPQGVVPGTSAVASRILGETSVDERPAREVPRVVRMMRLAGRGLAALALLVVLFLMLVTFVTPIFWRHYEHHFKLSEAPKHTLSRQNAPSDPLNVGLLGADWEVIRALVAAGWKPSDPSTFQIGLKFAKDSLKSMRYPSATLADLYLFGRRQDLLFEKPLAEDKPGRRALRLWRASELGMGGRPLWIGSVSLDLGPTSSDKSSGLGSHRIAPDVDEERDRLIEDLSDAFRLTEIYQVTGAGPTLSSRNDVNQAYFTDGELSVGVISSTATEKVPDRLVSPWGIRVKNQLWAELRPMLRELARD
ncbi:MAG: LssY C-terminal domain-containing protein [Isosphaeraceae bacterium]